jgi:hypothetical protein
VLGYDQRREGEKMSRYLGRLTVTVALLGALSAPFLMVPSASAAHTYAGWQDINYTGTLLFWGDDSPPGTHWDFANNVLSSVKNNSSGGKLCLYDGGSELMHLNPGVKIAWLGDYSANDQADDATLKLFGGAAC